MPRCLCPVLVVAVLAGCEPEVMTPFAVPDPSAPPRPTSLVFASDAVELDALGCCNFLKAEVRDQYGKPVSGFAAEWDSSDWSIVGVGETDQPMTVAFSGWANGTAVITGTVTADTLTITGSATITVDQKIATVTVASTGYSHGVLARGDSVRFAAEALDSNDNVMPDVRYVWRSQKPLVASVDASGLVAGLARGRAVIIAAASDVIGSADLEVVEMYPFHVHELSGDYPLGPDSWASIDSAVARWGTVLSNSIPRPYVFPADAYCTPGPHFEKGDTLAPGLHIWIQTVGGGGSAAASALACDWHGGQDLSSIPDSLLQIPAGTITSYFGSWAGWSTTAMHEIGHVLQWYGTDGYLSERHWGEINPKTLYFATDDRARELVEEMYRKAPHRPSHESKELDWDAAFPSGLQGIPLMSYYDNSPYSPEGHVNSCIGSHLVLHGETVNSQVANDIMTYSGAPRYITPVTLAMIDFPGYVYEPHMAEKEIQIKWWFNEDMCYGGRPPP